MASEAIEAPPHWVSVAGPVRVHPFALDEGDADRALRGMEMLAFEYPRQQWRTRLEERRGLVTRSIMQVESTATLPLVVIAGVVLTLGTGLLGVGSTSAVLVAGALGGGVFASAAIRRASRRRHLDSQRSNPPWLHITSTGICLGPLTRLWNGRGYALEDAALVEEAGLNLVVRFGGRRAPGKLELLYIPLPDELRDDVTEIVAVLRSRIASRQVNTGSAVTSA